MINQSLLVVEKPLKVRVINLKDNQVKLSLPDNQSFEINKKYLSANIKVGDELYLNLLTEEELKMTKREIAKKLLENILSKDEG